MPPIFRTLALALSWRMIGSATLSPFVAQ